MSFKTPTYVCRKHGPGQVEIGFFGPYLEKYAGKKYCIQCFADLIARECCELKD